jgi:beta-lactam-binding protein with PASTA domain
MAGRLTLAGSAAMIGGVSVAWARVLIACLVATGATGCSQLSTSTGSTTPPPAQRAIPALVGMPLSRAQARLTAAGFVISRRKAFSPTVAAGAVLSELPAAGQLLATGSTVTVTVSEGPGVVVPNTIGMTFAAAAHRMHLAGLTAGRILNYSSTVRAGLIFAQGAAAGTRVLPHSRVSLYISRGHAPVGVPNVRGLPLTEAVQLLRKAGLTVQVLKAPRTGASCPTGEVYRTYPHAHQLEPFRSLVKVVPCP